MCQDKDNGLYTSDKSLANSFPNNPLQINKMTGTGNPGSMCAFVA